MKTLTTLITSSIILSAALIGNAQAMEVSSDNAIASLIYENTSDVYAQAAHQKTMASPILSFSDDSNTNSVWSYEYEQYVNPEDFQTNEMASMNDVNQYLSDNPTSAGKRNALETFKFNETAGEYQIQ